MIYSKMKHLNIPILLIFLSAAILLYGCEESELLTPNSQEEISATEAESSEAANKAGKGVVTATVNVMDQMDEEGNRDVYADDAATLRRTKNGISFKVQMPTPEPGSYNYPTSTETATDEEGPPEAFTLWVFVIDEELGEFNGNPWSSAFLGGGHVFGGPNLTISGNISKETEPFGGLQLENPRDAEIHLAVAPHGALTPELMPEQIQTPSGPGPDVWWLAIFEIEE